MDYYTTEQAAKELGLERITVQKLAKTIGAQKFGRDYLLSQEDVDNLRRRPDGRKRTR